MPFDVLNGLQDCVHIVGCPEKTEDGDEMTVRNLSGKLKMSTSNEKACCIMIARSIFLTCFVEKRKVNQRQRLEPASRKHGTMNLIPAHSRSKHASVVGPCCT